MSSTPSLAQLKHAVLLCEQIEKLQQELDALLSDTRSALPTMSKSTLLKQSRRATAAGSPAGSRVSAQGSQRIAAAQRRRWARFRRARQEAAEQNGRGNGSHKSSEESVAKN